MLSSVTTPYEITEKMSQLVRAKSLRALEQQPGEPEDEIIEPASITTGSALRLATFTLPRVNGPYIL
ncbi:hypothetical protein D3C80_1515710 [compost metagenome]